MPLPRGRDPEALARACLAGGATWVQLRAKGHDDRAVLELALKLAGVCRGRATFVVNDRADLAVLAGADGAHVGQEDLAPAAARRVLGPHRRLGLSTHNQEQVVSARELDVDHLGFGPVFPSGTKQGHAPVTGVQELARAVRAAQGRPVFAIGGIGAEEARACAAAGAAGVAVVGALARAEDAEATARAILSAFREGAR
jgi:thiamine-phosphate pyrophosphorylase